MADELQITLNTGRVVGIGMIPTSRNMLAQARPMMASPVAAPDRCVNSNGCKWHWDANNYTGTCVTAYLANWISAVTPCDIPDANAILLERVKIKSTLLKKVINKVCTNICRLNALFFLFSFFFALHDCLILFLVRFYPF